MINVESPSIFTGSTVHRNVTCGTVLYSYNDDNAVHNIFAVSVVKVKYCFFSFGVF